MSKRQYPVVKDTPDPKDHILPLASRARAVALPSSTSLLPFLGPVKDQGQLGACTGFAFAGMREFLYRCFTKYEHVKYADPNQAVFSPMFQYFIEREMEHDVNEDGGAQSRTGMQVLARTGICLEKTWPYDPNKFTAPPSEAAMEECQKFKIGAYHRVPDLDTLRSVLASGYVASFAFMVYESFESDAVSQTGVMPLPAKGEDVLGGHETLAFGYDDQKQQVLVRNSWGPDWGSSGNFAVPYSFFSLGDDKDGNPTGIMDMWVGHLGPAWGASPKAAKK